MLSQERIKIGLRFEPANLGDVSEDREVLCHRFVIGEVEGTPKLPALLGTGVERTEDSGGSVVEGHTRSA